MTNTLRSLLAGSLFLTSLLAAAAQSQDPPAAAASPNTDLYGDPLPRGATARLGSVRFRHGRGFAKGIAFLPDSATVATCSNERSIRFWQARTGELVREFRVDPMSISGFALSADGKQLAVAGWWTPDDESDAQGEIRILNADTGEWLQTLKRAARDVDHHALAFTPSGKLLVSLGDQGTLRIEEIATGTELLTHSFPRDIGASLAISPDGKLIAVETGANSQKFFLWDWQSGKEPQELKTIGDPNGGGKIVFSPSGGQLAWVSHGSDPVHVWEVPKGTLLTRLKPIDPQEYFVANLAFDPAGKSLYVPAKKDRHGRIQVWNTADWKHERTLDFDAGLIAISPDAKLLATGNRALELESGRQPGQIADAHTDDIFQLDASQPGLVITASLDHSIRIWDERTGRQKLVLAHEGWVPAIAVSPDGRRLLSSSLDDTVRLWELPSGREIYRLPGHGRLGGRRAVAFTSGGERFLTFGDDFYLRVYRGENGKALEEFKIRPTGIKVPEEDEDREDLDFGMRIESASFSADGALLVLIARNKIFVYDALKGRELKTLDHDGGHIISQSLSPDGRRLLTCAWSKSVAIKLPGGGTRYSAARNHTATLWNLETGMVEATALLPEGNIRPGVFAPDGSRFAVSTGESTSKVTVFRLDGTVEAILPSVPGRISRLAFGRNGHSLITALDDTTVLIWGPEALIDPPPP